MMPGLRSRRCQLAAVVAGDALRVEAVEGGAVVLAFLQNRVPAQAGLRAFEDEKLEENAVVVLRQAPFLVVITNRQGVAGPGAADQVGRFRRHGGFKFSLRLFGLCGRGRLARDF